MICWNAGRVIGDHGWNDNPIIIAQPYKNPILTFPHSRETARTGTMELTGKDYNPNVPKLNTIKYMDTDIRMEIDEEGLEKLICPLLTHDSTDP